MKDRGQENRAPRRESIDAKGRELGYLEINAYIKIINNFEWIDHVSK